MPLSSFRVVPDEGEAVHLFTHLNVREDALDLFGFATVAERTIFTELISVSGIGPKRRARLLQQFGGLQGLSRAGIEDISTVEGISEKLAQEIYAAFHGNK